MAILEYIHGQGAVTVASTHYPEIKTFALSTPGFRNGAMAFDRQNLKPLFRLIIGQAGESQALWIAAKLGMLPVVLAKAEMHLQGKGRNTDGTVSKESVSVEMAVESAPPQMPELEAESGASDTGNVYNPMEFRPEHGPVPVKDLTDNRHTRGVDFPKQENAQAKVKQPSLQVGDLVNIPFLEEKGVVCTLPDAKGRMRVLVRGKKMDIPVKRVQLLIPAGELYPEDYDLNIVLLSKEERRLKHQMERKHTPGVTRVMSPEEQ
jgi:dsDNA-specific endonuclease/ATPase MutS2